VNSPEKRSGNVKTDLKNRQQKYKINLLRDARRQNMKQTKYPTKRYRYGLHLYRTPVMQQSRKYCTNGISCSSVP